jgi:methyl-accepting chemotaxis protein
MTRRITIGTKLLALSVLIAVLTVAVGVSGYWGIRGVAATAARALHDDDAVAQHALRLRADALGLRRWEKEACLAVPDAPQVAAAAQRFEEQRQRMDERLAALARMATSPRDRERLAELTSAIAAYAGGVSGLVARVRAGDLRRPADALDAMALHRDAAQRVEQVAEERAAAASARMEEAKREVAATAAHALWLMSVFVAVAVLGGVGLSVAVARSVTGPLTHLVGMLKDIAEGAGDLTRRVDITSRDEVGDTAYWFNTFIARVHDIMAQVRDAAAHAAAASRQVSGVAGQLASGAQAQASSLEETASSLEEITGTVKQTADNARQADRLAAGSRETAEKGGQVVTTAVAAMDEINRASKRIADIIGTIDEIAFQTNLLALNAAVEAARAGEQGRGFAVVAAEVRNLAQRSATAAKEIKALIHDSVTKVAAGSALVHESGQTLEEIVASVKRVTDIIGEIAAASQEQSGGIDQVNRAVSQMDLVVQANAAQTDALASTAQTLATQASQLQALVGRFELEGGRHAAGPVPAPPAPLPPPLAAPPKPPRRPPPAGTRATATATARTPSPTTASRSSRRWSRCRRWAPGSGSRATAASI